MPLLPIAMCEPFTAIRMVVSGGYTWFLGTTSWATCKAGASTNTCRKWWASLLRALAPGITSRTYGRHRGRCKRAQSEGMEGRLRVGPWQTRDAEEGLARVVAGMFPGKRHERGRILAGGLEWSPVRERGGRRQRDRRVRKAALGAISKPRVGLRGGTALA